MGEPDYINDMGFDSRFPETPGKILYGMNMAFNASLRSKDQSTKFGCYITDANGGTIVSGYNSPLSGLDDSKVPQTRPEKYDNFEHAERNAINQAAKKGVAIEDSIVYITGIPCVECMRALLNVEVAQIIYGSTTSVMCEKESQNRHELYKFWFSAKKTKLIKFKYSDGLIELNPKFKKRIEGQIEIDWQFNV